MRLLEIYLQPTRFNPRINATVWGAWMAVTDKGELPICAEFEAKNEQQAKEMFLAMNYQN